MGSVALYDGLRASDEAVAKVLGISEVARIARAEWRFREYLLVTWKRHARDAVKIAASRAEQGRTARQVAAAVRDRMLRWPKEVLPRVQKEVERVYQLAKVAGWKKATGQTKASLSYDTPNLTEILKAKPRAGFKATPSFGLVDEAAVDALQAHQVFWIGDHYDQNIGASIAEVSSATMVEAGEDRVLAGKLIKERLSEQMLKVATPLGFHGSAISYFEGVAANAVTTARAVGQSVSFMRAGITRYQVTNPADSRTCVVCFHMDGKTFSVEQGADTIGGVLAAETPEDVKKAQPWHGESKASVAELHKISPNPGAGTRADSEALSKAGFNMPPFHFRCVLEGQRVSGRFQGASKARYSGKAVELFTREGRRLAVTPNHPVLTAEGFVPAQSLREGDQLVCDSSESGVSFLWLGPQRHKDECPALVEDVFGAFAKCFVPLLVSPAADDFHGDARGFQGEVEVVGAYRELLLHYFAKVSDQRREFVLKRSAAGQSLVISFGSSDLALHGLFFAASCGPSVGALSFDSGAVFFDLPPLQELRFGPTADPDVCFTKDSLKRGPAEARFVRELFKRSSCPVLFDEICRVRQFDFSGHVFDFQTSSGLMVAQGIVISNCRCAVDIDVEAPYAEPVTPPWA